MTLKKATEDALKRCDGTWGMCIMNENEPGELVVACNGSPLVIGLGRNATYVASEPSAFNRYTKEFISMKDGEIGVVHADGRDLDLSRVETAPDLDIQLSPAPFPHWTIKECFEQPEAVARALCYGSRTGEKVRLSEERIDESTSSMLASKPYPLLHLYKTLLPGDHRNNSHP